MKQLFTIVRRHSGKFEIALGPDAPHRKHRAFVKELKGQKTHPEFSDVYPAMPLRRYKFAKAGEPKAKPAPAPKSFISKTIEKLTPKPAIKKPAGRKPAKTVLAQRLAAQK